MLKKRNLLLASCISVMVTGCSSQTVSSVSNNNEEVDPDIVKTIIVEADYSYYLNQYGNDCQIDAPIITSSESGEDNAVAQVIGSSTMEVGVTQEVTDLYITIPTVKIIEKLDEEQTVHIQDGIAEDNAYLNVEKIYIQKAKTLSNSDPEEPYEIVIEAKGKEASPYTVAYHTSAGENLGIGSSGYQIGNDLVPETIYYRYPVAENDESLLDEAALTFQRVFHLEYATEASFTSDEVNLHIIDPSNP